MIFFHFPDNTTFFSKCLKILVKGDDTNVNTNNENIQPSTKSFKQETVSLLFCFLGLQGSYLTWGILQEKIMTKEYSSTSVSEVGKFKDSQFLVFVNRVLAFLISAIYVTLTTQPRHAAPLYKYSFASFSNVMSSWCQYEALKFVSFPSQVLTKASKIIPVMIMGKIVSGKTYNAYEYWTALMISIGMTFFMLGNHQHDDTETVTTFSGVVILAGYMIFDSFTSNWQGKLFSQYRMSSVQMMCGINFFSCLLTVVSLVQQGGFANSFDFVTKYPSFLSDVLVLSVCSACGQLFIFKTISTFGPVTFVIITTVRQVLAIILSCFIYHHSLSELSIMGVSLVFFAVFLRIYFNRKLKVAQKKHSSSKNTNAA
ncbi:Adenosine 3'-phospho 5'-phosphosulfate transporter 1 [Nymphon striatum]|nr:Adenosine 3'-phospho 5'-phosphosulfate transporter 1 [Nymphon striatum]